MMSLTLKPRSKPDFRLEEIDGELLLYHPAQTTILYCNTSASLIWQLCDGRRTIEEIINLLAAAFEQEPETVSNEVTATIDLFCNAGAMEYLDND
jgi:hypothetical protein